MMTNPNIMSRIDGLFMQPIAMISVVDGLIMFVTIPPEIHNNIYDNGRNNLYQGYISKHIFLRNLLLVD